MMLLEPATTLTDYLLALECAWFAREVRRRMQPSLLRSAFAVLFGSVAAAAVFGGTVHGFFPDPAGAPSRILWTATMLAIGVTAAAMFAVAGALMAGPRGRPSFLPALLVAFAAYAGVVLFVRQEFFVAIVAYLPASLFLLLAFARQWHRGRGGGGGAGAVAGIAGVVLTLIGAAAQQAGVALHPVHFDHNAVYHVIQAVALYLLFRAALAAG